MTISLSRRSLDLTGHVYGKLTVIEPVSRNSYRGIDWLCQCECGEYKTVDSGSLRRGTTKACSFSCWKTPLMPKELPQYFRTAYATHKGNATRYGGPLDFHIWFSLVIQPCHYCGKFRNSEQYSGIDRTDSKAGYVPENCVPCCAMCNYAKGSLSYTDFANLVIDVYSHFIERL